MSGGIVSIMTGAAAFVGTMAGLAIGEWRSKRLRQRNRELRSALKEGREPAKPKNILRSVTRFLFVVPPIFAVIWVSWSYAIATYSTIALEQPFPITELGGQAITTLLGTSGLKVLENIFEHNEGFLFGKSKMENNPPGEISGEENGMG